jgi:hypothetical protein
MLFAGLTVQAYGTVKEGRGTDYYKEKYKGYVAIYKNKTETLEFTLEEDGPLFRNSSRSSLYVLSDRGIAFADNQEYFNSRYQFEKLKGYTLIPSGRRYKKVEATEYTKSSVLGSGIFYDDQVAYSFNFPAVSEGVMLVTEAIATVRDPHFPFRFYFGGGLPVETADFSFLVPKGTNIKYQLCGIDASKVKLTKKSKGKVDIYHWEALDLDAYKGDDLAPNWLYYVPHIMVQVADYSFKEERIPVLGNTQDLYNWAYAKVEPLVNTQSPVIKQLTDSIVSGLTRDDEIAHRIFRWVQKQIKYVAIEDGDNGFVPRPAEKVLERRYGDCKDKTSLIVAMLESQGLDASFAWIGTRSLPYKYSDIPSLAVDNHMIAVWWDDGRAHFLDGTTQFHALEDVPAWLQGKQCMIERGKEKFHILEVPVDAPDVNHSIDSIWINLEANTLMGEGKTIYSGEARAEMLSRLDGVKPEKVKNVISSSKSWASNKLLVDTAMFSDQSNLHNPLEAEYRFHLSDYVTEKQGAYYVNLNLDRMYDGLRIKKERVIPIESDKTFTHQVVTELKIPDGLKVSHVPGNVSFENEKFSYRSRYSLETDKVIVKTNYVVNFLLLEGDGILEFRKMINTIHRSSMQSVVLTQTN